MRFRVRPLPHPRYTTTIACQSLYMKQVPVDQIEIVFAYFYHTAYILRFVETIFKSVTRVLS
jgi:hypothetical protein